MDHTSALSELLSRHGFRRFMMSRSPVGHLKLAGQVDGRPIDIVLDTGASKTFVELSYCRSEGIAVTDTGQPGQGGNVFMLGDVQLSLDGLRVDSDGIFALDMSSTNQRLTMKGIDPIRAVIGQDVLRYHQAVIDYSTLALFLKAEPVFPTDPESITNAARTLAVRGYTATQISRELQRRGLDAAEADKAASLALEALRTRA
jgi:hypothetical protein